MRAASAKSHRPVARPIVLVVASGLLLSLGGRLEAADFIRGDTNGDGVVSVADVHLIESYLFVGMFEDAISTCAVAGDVNDDGVINLTDGIHILNFVILGGPGIPAPYPEPGPDPTPGEGDSPWEGCESYGGGAPLEDPSAALRILDVAVPGGESGLATITIAHSSSAEIAGFSGSMALGTLGVAEIAGVPGQGINDRFGLVPGGWGVPTAFVDGSPGDEDQLLFSLVPLVPQGVWIPAGDGSPSLDINICLEPGTPAGEYPLVLEDGELIDVESGRAIYPTLESGTLTILADVEDTECEADPPPPPPETRFALEDVEVAPGGEVTVPFRIRSEMDWSGFSFSLDFDEEVLEVTEVRRFLEKSDGTPWEFQRFDIDNDNMFPGDTGLAEGFVLGSAITSLSDPDEYLPADSEVDVLHVRLSVRPGTLATETRLRFLDGGVADDGVPFVNRLHLREGGSVTASESEGFSLLDATISIDPSVVPPPDVTFALQDTAATPGGSAAVAFSITSTLPSQGFSFSIDFDEEVLQATEIQRLFGRPSGTPYEFQRFELDNDNEFPGNTGVLEGYLVGAAILSLTDTGDVLPPNVEVPVLNFHFQVDPETSVSETELRFLDGGLGGDGVAVENRLIAGGRTITAETASSFIFSDGVMRIVPDAVPFLRGDVNTDGKVDMSDAISTLSFLFLGGVSPPCMDAADADDSGGVNMTDAIFTLGFLFQGMQPIPSPFPSPGVDPTEDGLSCYGM